MNAGSRTGWAQDFHRADSLRILCRSKHPNDPFQSYSTRNTANCVSVRVLTVSQSIAAQIRVVGSVPGFSPGTGPSNGDYSTEIFTKRQAFENLWRWKVLRNVTKKRLSCWMPRRNMVPCLSLAFVGWIYSFFIGRSRRVPHLNDVFFVATQISDSLDFDHSRSIISITYTQKFTLYSFPFPPFLTFRTIFIEAIHCYREVSNRMINTNINGDFKT